MLGTIGLFLALAALAYLTVWRSWTVIPSALACVLIIFTNGQEIWPTYANVFSGGLVGYLKSFFIMMALSTLFSKFMSDSGCAESIALKFVKVCGLKHIGLALLLLGGVLSYGGINGVVVIFTVYPIGVVLVKKANLPRQYVLGAAGSGAATYATLSMPGTPQTHNLVPTQFLGTTTWAAPYMGLVSSLVMFIARYIFLDLMEKYYRKRGVGFTPGPHEKSDIVSVDSLLDESERLPDWKLAMMPLVIVVGVITLLNGRMDAVGGVCYALVITCVFVYLTNRKRFREPAHKMITDGLNSGVLVVCTVAAIIGFGKVVQSVPAFQNFIDFCMNMEFSPYVNMSVAINVFCAMTGSSVGGLTMFMQTMAERYVEMGFNPEVIHRLSVVASGALDTVPWSGACITYITACGLDHKKGYPIMFFSNVIIPWIGTVACILCALAGIV